MSNIFYKQPRIALKFSFLLHTHLVKKNLEKSQTVKMNVLHIRSQEFKDLQATPLGRSSIDTNA